MHHAAELRRIIKEDPFTWPLLGIVRSLNLPDSWIGAGFVRNAVWDHLHGRRPSFPKTDIDVIWHDPARAVPAEDERIEALLKHGARSVAWSVKNQARMHTRNGDQPYASSTDAMAFWPETATAVAVRRTEDDQCDIAAPYGLDDLFKLLVRPTPRFAVDKRDQFEARVISKRWATIWPRVRIDPR